MGADGRRGRILSGVVAALLLTTAAGAAIPKSPTAPPQGVSGVDALVAQAMIRAKAGDCRSVLSLLDPVVVGAGAPRGSASRFSAQLLRMPCLAAVGRGAEIAPVLAELKTQAPSNPLVQGFQVFVDADAGHFADAADGLAAIADARSRALALMPGDLWRALAQKLTLAGDIQRRDRVALALALADWAPSDRPELPETLATDAVGTLLDQQAVDDARQLLSRVHRPDYLWEMAIQRRYAALWPDLEAKIGAEGGRAIDTFARSSLDAYADAPQDPQTTLNASRAFLFLGRFDDVSSTTAAIKVVPGMSEQQVNAVLTEATALAAAGHRDQALARLRPFESLDFSATPEAAGALIALAELLDDEGRFDEELTVSRAGKADYFSPYGLAWLGRNEVCALTGLKRVADANAAADALKAGAAYNQAAAIEGLLCAGRDDEAAAIAIVTLDTHEGADRLADQFQPDAALLPHPASRLRGLWARLLARPDVKAAFDRSARILPKIYWPATTPRALPAPTGVQDAASTT
jgi:hypothetical protein